MIVNSIHLKSGRSPGSPSQEIPVGAITIFVGPNNSGKSKALSEIEQYITNPGRPPSVVLSGVDFNGISDPVVAETEFKNMETIPPQGITILPENNFVTSKRGSFQLKKADLIKAIMSPLSNFDLFSIWLSAHVLMLGGANRINLINEQQAGDFQNPPQTSFQRIFRDDKKRLEFRTIVHNALGFYPVIDPTNPGRLRFKISDRAPSTEIEERGWHTEAIAFHSKAEAIEQSSDGIKAFSGIVLELIAGNPRLLLIDEPEAFLHPALAFKLGNEIGKLALKEEKSVFVSTHSSSFLMGCLQSGSTINIVRLTYTKKIATSRVLPSSKIVELMRNPLLRSSGVISALFYDFVIVTESDADRAFYSEINERLLRFRPEWGIQNCLFLNSQGKHTLGTIVKPLRELGIPTACIVDIDVLKDGGSVWTRFLDSANVPKISQAPFGAIRSSIFEAFRSSGKDMRRDGGLSLLPEPEKQAGADLFENMAEYGIFAIYTGELESWLKSLGATGHGPPWLIDIFERMGEDPASASYAKPADGDVWHFMSLIKNWLTNPSRKGIPA
jgi:hypothetical protein